MGVEFALPWFLPAVPVFLGWLWYVFIKKGGRGLKARVSVALRSVSAVLLCLAMAGMSVVWRGRDAQLIILADRSQSMENRRDEQESWIRQIEERLPENYELSVIAFGGDSRIESGFEDTWPGRLNERVQDSATDFEQALRFASAFYGPGAAKQALLLTDGADNGGDVSRLTALLSASAVRVDAHIFEQDATGDAQVTRVDVPDTVYLNEQFDILVEIDSETEKQAELLLYSGAALMSSRSVSLQKGKNSFVFRDVARDAGLVDYRAVIQEAGGTIRNNQRSTVAKVIGAPRILLIEGLPGAADEMERMLEAASTAPEKLPVTGLPRTAAGMQRYDAVVLSNVNAEDISPEQIAGLEHFVRTLGRGLVVIGGDNSYALGGYIGSELEKILPVESNVRNKLDVPSLALVLAIDHSGSMGESSGGVTRLALARESAQRAVEQLTAKDRVGVIAFDDRAKWVAQLQPAENKAEVNNLIGGLRVGGGTMMYSSIDLACAALRESDAAIKHMILLTDGQPADSGFESLVTRAREDGITVSGVAMGRDANDGLMRRLSELGGGRFYHVDADDNIPSIFAKETQLSTQSYLQNRVFYPAHFMDSPMTASFDSGLPMLTGFLATVAKPAATVALRSDNSLPILAHWQYGAGQVAAWTSDAEGQWSGSFLGWGDSAAFFSGFVSNVLSTQSGRGYLALEEESGRGTLSLSVEGLDRAETHAAVIAPDGTELRVPMRLVRPGEFSGEFPLEQEGVYAVKVGQTENGQLVNSLESGLPRGYSAEYDIRGESGALSQSVARLLALGGSIIETPAQVFEKPLDRVERRYDLLPLLLTLGLLLFFLDIAARRLQWEAKLDAVLAEFSRRPVQESKPEKLPENNKQPPKAPKEKPRKAPPATSADMSAELLARRRGKK